MPRAQMTPEQAAETAFCVFLSPAWGFRAMATIFHTYCDADKITTLREAIKRWAPPSENNTEAYVDAVCRETEFPPDAPFPFHDAHHMACLLHAVSHHECGGWFFSDADLQQGVQTAH